LYVSIILFLGLLLIAAGDAEVSELVSVLVGGNDAEVIAELLLLEVTLGKVLELALGETEVGGGSDGELVLLTGDDNAVGGQGTGLAVDLDAIVKVLLEGGNVEDLILNGSRAVKNELDGLLFAGLALWLCDGMDML
jgi:hypothetical protein